MDLAINTSMNKVDKEGNQETVNQMFSGGARTILRENQFEEAYVESINKIWKNFDEWISNGSGWRLNRVQNIYLNTAAYEPIRGSSYIKTPKAIEGKKAIINVQNKDDKCFMWAVLSARHPAKDHVDRVDNYTDFEGELDFKGISFPVTVDDIPKFERLNNIPISVYSIKHDGKQVNPLYCTKRRDKEPIS